MPQTINPVTSLLTAIVANDRAGVIAWTNTLTHVIRFGGDTEIEAIRAIAQAYLSELPEQEVNK